MAHGIALGGGDEDDLFAAPSFQTLDQRCERNILAVQCRVLTQIGG